MSASLGGRQRLGDEGGLELLSASMVASASSSAFVDLAGRAAGANAAHVADQQPRRQRLHRLPAVERIAVMRREQAAGRRRDRLAVSLIGAEKLRLSRQHRPLVDAAEHEALRRLARARGRRARSRCRCRA